MERKTKRVNDRNNNKYQCTIIEMHGQTGSGKTFFGEKIKEILEAEGFKILFLEGVPSETYIQKQSKDFDLIILDELPRKGVKYE